MDILYYDSQCPLCRREIGTLSRLHTGGLGFADIHTLDQPDLPSREQLLRRLHLKATNGRWYVGLEANVRAWSHTRLGWLFRPLLWPGLHAVARRIYERWADRRYERRYQCGVCSADRT